MSGASYRRGNRVISRQICAEYGCLGCARCSSHTPTPRPPTWGNAARERAERVAAEVLASAKVYGLPRPSLDCLVEVVKDRARVGANTAQLAAEHVYNSRG